MSGVPEEASSHRRGSEAEAAAADGNGEKSRWGFQPESLDRRVPPYSSEGPLAHCTRLLHPLYVSLLPTTYGLTQPNGGEPANVLEAWHEGRPAGREEDGTSGRRLQTGRTPRARRPLERQAARCCR
jgi:hypothetical protein